MQTSEVGELDAREYKDSKYIPNDFEFQITVVLKTKFLVNIPYGFTSPTYWLKRHKYSNLTKEPIKALSNTATRRGFRQFNGD